MGEINRRIRSLRKYFGLTQAEIAQKCEISQSNQSRYEHGYDVPYSYMNKLMSQFPSVNPCWLCSGRGRMLNPTGVKKEMHPVPEEELKTGYFDDISWSKLTKAEAGLLNEVKQFSDFLKTRDLPMPLKRSLLQLLIEHIDQTIQSHPDNFSENDDS